MSPRVEAVIPTCNAPTTRLREAIRSCLAAPEVGRVIVVDDGSRVPVDAAVCAEMGRVVVVRQANAGPSAARNAGIEKVAAEFVLFLDDDDELVPEGLTAMLSLADQRAAVAVVAAREEVREAGERGEKTIRLKSPPEDLADTVLASPARVFQPHAVFGGSGMLVRMAALRSGLRFDPGLWVGEDREFLRRVGEVGPIAVSSRVGLRVMLHDQAENLSAPARFARRAKDLVSIMRKHLDAESEPYLKEQTIWLLNAMARESKSDPAEPAWRELRLFARERGWKLPVRTRWRQLWKGLGA